MTANAFEIDSGVEVPTVGLGTWPSNDGQIEELVPAALDAGYRLFDTAEMYGNERGLGRGLRASGMNREDYFVTSKLGKSWHSRQGAKDACQRSLEVMGLEYLDMFMIHWPCPSLGGFVEAWRGLQELRAEGLIRVAGTSNFTAAHLTKLQQETGSMPEVNQIEFNPYYQRKLLRDFHAEHGIATQAWSPLGRGGDVLIDPQIAEIAMSHNRTPAQVILRWLIEVEGYPIVRSTNPVRLKENMDVLDFSLRAEEVSAIATLDCGLGGKLDPDVFEG